MKKNKIVITFLLILSCLTITISATTEYIGSITLNFKYDNQAIDGAQFSLYQVGELNNIEGDLLFKLTNQFINTNIEINDLNSNNNTIAAKAFVEYIEEYNITGTNIITNKNIIASFNNLSDGVYLIYHSNSFANASKFHKVEPLLIYISNQKEYLRNVEIYTKTGPIEDIIPPNENELPNTGLNQLPVVLLAFIGMVFVTAALIEVKKR